MQGVVCSVDSVTNNGVPVDSPFEFDVVMTEDITIEATCSCRFPVTVTFEGPCDVETGTTMHDLNDATSIPVGVTDSTSCRVKTVTVNGIERSNRNMVRITDINKPFDVHAICVCD